MSEHRAAAARATLVVLVSAGVLLGVHACGSDTPTRTGTTDPGAEVAEVVVTPERVRVGAGDTVRFQARARDANGEVLSGVDFAWASSDTTAVTVGEDGLARSVGEGRATITATADGVAGSGELEVTPFGAETQRAMDLLLESVAIESPSEIVFTDAVPAATQVREAAEEAAELSLPDATGTYYPFVIDDEPDAKLGHPLRFGYVDPTAGSLVLDTAYHPLTVQRPDSTPAPFVAAESAVVDGVEFTSGTGDFAARPVDTGHKAAESSLAISSLFTDRCAGESTTAEAEGGAGRTPARSQCPVRMAYVFDTGDENGWVSDGIAAEAAQEADTMAAWLRSEGFQTHRVSQYWGNSHPAYMDTAMAHDAFYSRIRGILRSLAEIPCEGDVRCHEFVLYLTGHGGHGASSKPDTIGSNNDWRIYRADGSGEYSHASYQGLFLWVPIPPNVKVTILVDICFGGGMINAARDRGLCDDRTDGDCGFTIIAATSKTRTTKSGFNSFTRRLMRADTIDQDNDGRAGDLWDRFAHLAGYQGDRNRDRQGGSTVFWSGPLNTPQAWHCPNDGDWCSLDSGTP